MPVRRKRSTRTFPRLLLQGRWLERAGFVHGSPVAIWADEGCLIVQAIRKRAEVPSEPFAVHDSLPTSTAEPACEDGAPEVLEGVEQAISNVFGPAAFAQTLSMIASPGKFSARPRLGGGHGIHHSPTVRQFLTLNDERTGDGYKFLARREVNSPLVCKALGVEIVAQREALGLTAKQVYVRADLPASHYYGIEGGSRPMSIAVFLSVSEALSIHPRELFNRALGRMRYPNCTRPPDSHISSQPPSTAETTRIDRVHVDLSL